MRRLVWLMVLGVAGCSDFFSAHAGVAATAAGHELSSERLARLMTNIKGLQLTPDAAEFLATVWVDYALFADAVANGTLPEDSLSITEVMWPDIAEIKADRWYEHLIRDRSPITEASADSVYDADSVRVLQHILISVSPQATAAVREEARREAERAARRVRQGENFARLASDLSGDPGSRTDGGYLPPTPRGQFVPAFDSAGWSLSEGAMTGAVETPFGYHVIRRPPREEVRDRLLGWLLEMAEAQLDSAYLENLGRTKSLEIERNAPALVRQALDDEAGMYGSTRKLAAWDGGELTVSDLLRWIPAMGPTAARQIRGAEAEQLEELVRQLSYNQMVLLQADSAGFKPNELQWLGVQQAYRARVDTLIRIMGLYDDVTEPSLTVEQRTQVVELKLDRFFDRLASGQVRLRPLPSALGHMLRQGQDYSVNLAGVNEAARLAEEGPAPAAEGPLQPATGPPPVGGGAAPGQSDSTEGGQQ